MQYIIQNFATTKGRYATYNGRRYLVVPMTLLVPGVLNGSMGPLLYRSQAVAANAAEWNGVPVVVNHPEQGSARQTNVLRTTGIGVLFNCEFSAGKLRATGWIDVEKARQVDPRLLTKLQGGQTIEVSTGVGVDLQQAIGVENGRTYSAIVQRLHPDHLAILPNDRGACSIADGCGVNTSGT